MPFRMRGHPWTTGVFILAALYVVVGSIVSNLDNALKGTALILLGVPVYWAWSRRRGTTQAE